MNIDLMCGAGKAEISLPIGTPMGGYANRTSPCQGVLDPLSARALLLRTEQQACLVLTLDALTISAVHARELADVAAQSSGGILNPAYVRVVCSHTHSGADLSGMFGDAGQIAQYFELVRNGTRDATRQAAQTLAPAHVRQGATNFPIGKNRRLRPGHARVSDLERAQGEQIDHTLTVLRFEQPETGAPIATLFHTACHPVCLGPENVRASGDFAGIAAQTIEQQTGAPALFMNGACGNVTPIIGRGSSYAATRELGQSVARTALDVISQSAAQKPGESETLSMSAPFIAQLPLGCHYQTADEIDQAAARLLSLDTGFLGWEDVVRRWQSHMQRQLADGSIARSVPAQLSALRIGGLIFVFLGAEAFNEYQRWQPGHVRLVGYTDAEGCYIPTAAAIAGGGYEVESAPVFYGLPCAPGPAAEKAFLAAIDAAYR
jgi:neutral ceramidase